MIMADGSEHTAGPDPADEVWISTPRAGIDAHRIADPTPQPGVTRLTGCGRSMRTGVIIPFREAERDYRSAPCPRCWPAEPLGADTVGTAVVSRQGAHAGAWL